MDLQTPIPSTPPTKTTHTCLFERANAESCLSWFWMCLALIWKLDGFVALGLNWSEGSKRVCMYEGILRSYPRALHDDLTSLVISTCWGV